MLQVEYHSDHIEELKEEIKKKFKSELNGPDNYLKRQAQEVINCLNSAVVPVDILRSADFNTRLNPRSNFYGLKLNTESYEAFCYTYSPKIRRSLQITNQLMSRRDMWKFFLSTVLMEIQEDEHNLESVMRIGTECKVPGDEKVVADFVIAGPKPNMEIDFPLLLVDICTFDDISGIKERGARNLFNPRKMQSMMVSTLINLCNSRTFWPLPALNHLFVYGLIILEDGFYICKMALRPEKHSKFAFVFTKGKRMIPLNLFIAPKNESDDFEREFGKLSLNENKAKNSGKDSHRPYRKFDTEAVMSIISLLQTVISQFKDMKIRDRKYK